MPHSMHYPVEPFIPRANGSRAPDPQQQEETTSRNGSVTPTPRRRNHQMSIQNDSRAVITQASVIMPATNGSGRSFPSATQRIVSRTPVSHPSIPQPQQITMQNGNGSSPANTSLELPRIYPVFMILESQTYIRFDAASRFFGQGNVNAAAHPPNFNSRQESWAPHVNEHNVPLFPQPNGLGDHSFVTEQNVFRPQTAPPPLVSPEGLPTRERSDTIRSHEDAFRSPPPYYPSRNSQYHPDYSYPVLDTYYPMGQTQHPVYEFKQTVPSVPWFAPVYLRKTAPIKSDDPEAKLFVGDLPVRMTTEALSDALRRRFRPFGKCKVNVTWKSKLGPDGVSKSLPTGWIQYENVFEAAKALDVAKERCFAIGKRPVRIDRADGKRICRVWPTNSHATPGLDDFENAIRECAHRVGLDSAYCMVYHVSNKIEMVDKRYGGRTFNVPSVGLVFRWVEDASYSEQKLFESNHRFRLRIEHVNCNTPGWREGPMNLKGFDALVLDTGEKWQEELILSRRRLRDHGEEFPCGKMARYPERISKQLIPRSILEHPRLRKDIFACESLEWLDLHRESPTPLARAINYKKIGKVNGQTNGYCNGDVKYQTTGGVSSSKDRSLRCVSQCRDPIGPPNFAFIEEEKRRCVRIS